VMDCMRDWIGWVNKLTRNSKESEWEIECWCEKVGWLKVGLTGFLREFSKYLRGLWVCRKSVNPPRGHRKSRWLFDPVYVIDTFWNCEDQAVWKSRFEDLPHSISNFARVKGRMNLIDGLDFAFHAKKGLSRGARHLAESS
jgi:hypothetical protein